MTLNLDHQNINRQKFVLKEFQNELQHHAYYTESKLLFETLSKLNGFLYLAS